MACSLRKVHITVCQRPKYLFQGQPMNPKFLKDTKTYCLLLWCHISFCPTKCLKVAFVIFSCDDMAQAKVTYFRYHVFSLLLALTHQYVFKLDITVNNSLFMNKCQPVKYGLGPVLKFMFIFDRWQPLYKLSKGIQLTSSILLAR